MLPDGSYIVQVVWTLKNGLTYSYDSGGYDGPAAQQASRIMSDSNPNWGSDDTGGVYYNNSVRGRAGNKTQL